jgi:hypothetical protein
MAGPAIRGLPRRTSTDALHEGPRWIGGPADRVLADCQNLIYELLDAHGDTADLARELQCEPPWAAHLEYLQALQRTGRQAPAQMSTKDTQWV